MEELDDEYLKKIFGRLADYQTDTKGVDWRTIEKSMKPFRTGRIVSFLAAVTVSLILMLLPSPAIDQRRIDGLAQQVSGKATDAEFVGVADVSDIQESNNNTRGGQGKANVAIKLSDDNSIVSDLRSDGRPVADSVESGSKLANPRPESIALKANVPSPRVELDSVLEVKFANFQPREPSIVKQSFQLRLSTSYLFGVVDPSHSDNISMNDYKARPGYGIKAEILIPVLQNETKVLHLAPSYQFLKKEYDFVTKAFTAEAGGERRRSFQASAHLLGMGVELMDKSSLWNIGTTIQHNFGSGPESNRIAGTNSLSFNVLKGFHLDKNQSYSLTAGASFIMPLSGQPLYFTYYPIQVSLGIQKAFTKRDAHRRQ